MRLPAITGVIKRRLLVNFRVDPEIMQKFLPAPFRPKLHCGHAIAGICLIRLEHIRPAGFPAFVGLSSENAAHRIAVEWSDDAGLTKEGVFIPRRDTDSLLNHLAGGRIFPGEHHQAKFRVSDDGASVELAMNSRDQKVSVHVRGHESGSSLPVASCFASLDESSRFFEGGSLGYSVTRNPDRFDGLILHTKEWRLSPFLIDDVQSSFFSDHSRFPANAIQFDHALIMRDKLHEWHGAADLCAKPQARCLAKS